MTAYALDLFMIQKLAVSNLAGGTLRQSNRAVL
jgi:hypothetical protein